MKEVVLSRDLEVVKIWLKYTFREKHPDVRWKAMADVITYTAKGEIVGYGNVQLRWETSPHRDTVTIYYFS